ncbi:MAG: hypothetical protein IKX46_08000, partial [Verrucomicrobia bacterium]|nr:hypothetical protein [Verrucomicrobiota bacterium]
PKKRKKKTRFAKNIAFYGTFEKQIYKTDFKSRFIFSIVHRRDLFSTGYAGFLDGAGIHGQAG